jgi:hypothetical protein
VPPRVSLGSKPSGLAVFLVPAPAEGSKLPSQRINLTAVRYCPPQARFRRDLHPLVTRLTTVCLDCFGFGTLAQ